MGYRGDFNMTERLEDKSNNCEKAISDLERLNWGELLNTLQHHGTYVYQGGTEFFWTNRQHG